uniref:Uncharacterized protein n=1 Tax=Parascaris univalens TaxID=6257 RepID=A0A915C0D5_PARUN
MRIDQQQRINYSANIRLSYENYFMSFLRVFITSLLRCQSLCKTHTTRYNDAPNEYILKTISTQNAHFIERLSINILYNKMTFAIFYFGFSY